MKTRAVVWLLMIIALLAFWYFNYGISSTGLQMILGGMGESWPKRAVFLAIFLCLIDFFGLAKLFSVDPSDPPVEGHLIYGTWIVWIFLNALLIGYTSIQLSGLVLIPVIYAVCVLAVRYLLIQSFYVLNTLNRRG